MEKECFDSYLENRYKEQVRWYSSKSAQNKRYYHWFQWSVIVISAAVPVMIVRMPHNLQWITVILSIFVTIATSALKSFNFQENWISYRTIAETLKKEKHYYDAGANGYSLAEDREQFFVERVENFISRENTLWVATHAKEDHEKDAERGQQRSSSS